MTEKLYGYYINLDERGEFRADVRDIDGNSIFDVDQDGARDLIEDGFVRNIRDAAEIGRYLMQSGVIDRHDLVLPMQAFEARRDEASTERPYESLYGEHTVTVTVSPVVTDEELSSEDRQELGFLTAEHTFIINDLPGLIDSFLEGSSQELKGMRPEEQVRHMLREAALDRFHDSVAIKVLEDFDISISAVSAKALSDGLTYLREVRAKERGLEDQGLSP